MVLSSSPVTIVIPVYNRAHTLARTLGSIDAQTVCPAEVIVVDNNSTDDSLEIARRWAAGKGYVQVLTESFPGACAARNFGLRHVRTSWTMFFDSDDVMYPNHVADFTDAIASRPDADIIGRDILKRSLDGSLRRLYFHAGRESMFHHIFRGCLSTQRYVARTSLFRAVGGWNESLGGWNDFELGVRLLLQRPSVVELGGAPSVTTYQQAESISGINFSSHPERWEDSLCAVRKLFSIMPGDGRDKRRYINYIDAKAMILAAQYRREGAQELSSALYDRIMEQSPCAVCLRLIYLHNRYFNRLTWLLAGVLL